MKRVFRAVGIWPPLVASACFAVLGAAALGPLVLGDDAPPRGEQAVLMWGEVPDAWLDGLALLREGQAAEALRALALAESVCGVAPPALLRARLHAALETGDWVDAELTAEKLALRAGEEALYDFVVGFAEYARSARAGVEAEQPGADPTAFDRAIHHATAAALAFQAASLGHEDRDWPAARRNAERAAARRAELVGKRERAERDRRRERDPQQQEPDPGELEQIEQELQLAEDAQPLSAVQLYELLQRLARAEAEKHGVRSAAGRERSAGVEQDW